MDKAQAPREAEKIVYRVAVASSDGKVVNQHFGRSRQFLIFEIDEEGKYSFLELRPNAPPCSAQEHDDEQMDASVNLLADCRVVLVSRIGPGAELKLRAKGIRAYSIPDFIDQALEKLLNETSLKGDSPPAEG